MSRYGQLSGLVRVGCLFMLLGNALLASLKYQDVKWKYVVYLFPANLGQGIAYPSILFTFLAAFDHSRKLYFLFGLWIRDWLYLEQAVSTSMVYLFRSMGTVWGVAASSAIIQNILAKRLPLALAGFPDSDTVSIFLDRPWTIAHIYRSRLWTKSGTQSPFSIAYLPRFKSLPDTCILMHWDTHSSQALQSPLLVSFPRSLPGVGVCIVSDTWSHLMNSFLDEIFYVW